MCFDGWCVYRADRVRRDLDALMTELLRTRLAREHAAGIHRAYDAVAESVAHTVPLAPPPRRACVNHPDRWAQDGEWCRACNRDQSDTRTTRERQQAEARE